MKKAKKILALLLCAVLLVGATIAGTVAYLTSTDDVTNTFTVGKVYIYLDEEDVDDSKTDPEEGVTGRDKANAYHLLPGSEYDKDPTVHVKNDSDPSYIFVKVENGLAVIEASTTIADQIAANGWTAYDADNGIYYKTWAKAEDATGDYTDLVVFENFTIKSDIDGETLADYEDAKIVVTAYAIQQTGFENDIAGAWAAVSAAAEDNG